jgi:hypothetical protein
MAETMIKPEKTDEHPGKRRLRRPMRTSFHSAFFKKIEYIIECRTSSLTWTFDVERSFFLHALALTPPKDPLVNRGTSMLFVSLGSVKILDWFWVQALMIQSIMYSKGEGHEQLHH